MLFNKELLKSILNNENIDEVRKAQLFCDLKLCFREFINILYNKELDNYRIYRKVLLNKCEFSKILFDSEIITLLSKYYKQDFSCLDKFITFFINEFKINCDLSILQDRIKNVYRFNENGICKNRTVNPDKYKEFDRLMSSSHIVNFSDLSVSIYSDPSDSLRMQEVFSEYLIYQTRFKDLNDNKFEYDSLENKHIMTNRNNLKYRWLSKYDGDGYGADLLFVLSDLKKEELHEVKKQLLDKSNNYNYSIITDTEKKVIDEVLNEYKNTDYFIDIIKMQFKRFDTYDFQTYKYVLDKDTGLFICDSLSEDKSRCELIETDNGYLLKPKEKTLII